MQHMLTVCGYPCGSIDGEFGEKTAEGLIRFKKEHGLKHNARYYPVTRKKLKTVYKKEAGSFASRFLTACQNVVDRARTERWRYGDSRTFPPCEDKLISCDRLIARALYDLGFTDQRAGGETCGTLDSYLTTHGFTKVNRKNQLRPGAVVAVRNKEQNFINHVFVVKSYDHDTGICVKYDTGSNERIRTKQPTTAKLVEWPERVFVAGYNVPGAILSADHISTDPSSAD